MYIIIKTIAANKPIVKLLENTVTPTKTLNGKAKKVGKIKKSNKQHKTGSKT